MTKTIDFGILEEFSNSIYKQVREKKQESKIYLNLIFTGEHIPGLELSRHWIHNQMRGAVGRTRDLRSYQTQRSISSIYNDHVTSTTKS